MGQALLDGVPLQIDPDQVQWAYRMKIADTKTLGGKVVQILGTELGDMTVTGVFGAGDRTMGDTEGWQAQQRFAAWIKSMSRTAEKTLLPVRFVYAPRKWDFHVFVKRLDQEPYENQTFNPRWNLTLFIVQDNTGTVVKGIRDLYIERLMAGIGWKQTDFNGPRTQGEVDAITGGDLQGYLQGQFEGIASGQQPGTGTGGGG